MAKDYWSFQVKYLRRLLGWKQINLAEALVVSPITVSKWENGVREPLPVHKKKMQEIAEEKGFFFPLRFKGKGYDPLAGKRLRVPEKRGSVLIHCIVDAQTHMDGLWRAMDALIKKATELEDKVYLLQKK